MHVRVRYANFARKPNVALVRYETKYKSWITVYVPSSHRQLRPAKYPINLWSMKQTFSLIIGYQFSVIICGYIKQWKYRMASGVFRWFHKKRQRISNKVCDHIASYRPFCSKRCDASFVLFQANACYINICPTVDVKCHYVYAIHDWILIWSSSWIAVASWKRKCCSVQFIVCKMLAYIFTAGNCITSPHAYSYLLPN